MALNCCATLRISVGPSTRARGELAAGDFFCGAGERVHRPCDNQAEAPRQHQQQDQDGGADDEAAEQRFAVIGQHFVLGQAGEHTPAGARHGRAGVEAGYPIDAACGKKSFAYPAYRLRLRRRQRLAYPGLCIDGAQQESVLAVEHHDDRVRGNRA